MSQKTPEKSLKSNQIYSALLPYYASYITFFWEILDSFFKNHNIIPTWTISRSYGWYDEELGKWTEMVGEVIKM